MYEKKLSANSIALTVELRAVERKAEREERN
jgi:hypothetical protein